MRNALTIDVEDYFQVTAFSGVISRADWPIYPSRVQDNTKRILDILARYNVKATFFVLGWVGEHFPMLVRAISDAGHEVACHGYDHQLVYNLNPKEFREDIRRAKKILEDITGRLVLGYRAPSYSITKQSMWALEILLNEGFVYDSSIFPVYHDTYGIPNYDPFPHTLNFPEGSLCEFPLSTMNFSFFANKIALPIAGGGYLRLLPAKFISWAIKRMNINDRQPAVVYLHPWEIDPCQPRISAPLKSRLRHYLNLDRTESKLCHLLSELQFDTMANILDLNDHKQAFVLATEYDKRRFV